MSKFRMVVVIRKYMDDRAFRDRVFRPPKYDTLGRLVDKPKNINDLCQRSLVRKEEETGTVQMHDVLKALGRRMVDDQEDLRITGQQELDKLYALDDTLQKVVALHGVNVEALHLQQMRQLRLLIDVRVIGECENSKLNQLRMVDGLYCSRPGVFDWSKCASLKHVCWGRKRWEREVLDESDSAAPDVSNLEVFKHDNISESLEVLQLHNWRALKDVQVIETLTCLKLLCLEDCPIESLPDGLMLLTGLTQLYLSHCESLKSIPEGIGKLMGLTQLDLSWCKSLQSIPEGIGNLTGLTQLDLRICEKLQSIPEGIGNLTSLTQLSLEFCESLKSIPEGIGNLTNLTGFTRLDLSGCRSLQSIPEGIGNLTGFTEFYLSGCERLQSIPEGIGNLTGLTELYLSSCKSLQSIPEGIGNLTGLIQLDLRSCENLQSIPKGIGNLTGLRMLNLSDCKSLQSIPEGIGNLTGLNIYGRKSLPTSILERIGNICRD